MREKNTAPANEEKKQDPQRNGFAVCVIHDLADHFLLALAQQRGFPVHSKRWHLADSRDGMAAGFIFIDLGAGNQRFAQRFFRKCFDDGGPNPVIIPNHAYGGNNGERQNDVQDIMKLKRFINEEMLPSVCQDHGRNIGT